MEDGVFSNKSKVQVVSQSSTPFSKKTSSSTPGNNMNKKRKSVSPIKLKQNTTLKKSKTFRVNKLSEQKDQVYTF